MSAVGRTAKAAEVCFSRARQAVQGPRAAPEDRASKADARGYPKLRKAPAK